MPPQSGRPRRRLLILGSVREAPEVLRDCDGASTVIAPLSALGASLLQRGQPDAVLAPLVGAGHGLAEVAERLANLGYIGPLRGYCRPCPAGSLARDLTAAYPGIDVELVEIRR